MRAMSAHLRLSRREFAAMALAGAGAPPAAAAAAAPKFPVGVFIANPDETVELEAYADHHGFGRLRMSYGLLGDIPVVEQAPVVVCNLASWWLQTVWFTSQRIFYEDAAERRQLSYTVRRYSMTTVAAIVRGLDDDKGVARLMAAVGANRTTPGYLVATISNGAVVRDYLGEVRPRE